VRLGAYLGYFDATGLEVRYEVYVGGQFRTSEIEVIAGGLVRGVRGLERGLLTRWRRVRRLGLQLPPL
jgi:hypothetical protein